MGDWKIVVPEAATNVVPNPSIEQATAGYFVAGTGTTINQSSEYARFGVYSLKCVTGNTAANDGWFTPFSTLTDAVLVTAGLSYTFSVYLRGSGTVTMRMDFRNAAFASTGSSASSVITLSSAWTRYTLTATAPALSVLVSIQVRTNVQQALTFYADGIQVEAKAYATTYVDGDQPGGTWAGLRHLSTSSRAANYRLGGREYDIQTQYGLRVRQFGGAGAPDYELMTQDLALQPGAVYLREKINARTLTLTLDNNSTSAAGLHSKRKAFWNVIKPDALGGSQPFLIGYAGGASGKTVYSAVRYAGGWGLSDGVNGGANTIEAGGSVALRLLAVDPFWYADDAESATIDYQDSVASNNYALARIGGAWQNLGTGFDGVPNAVVFDKERGRVYFGGVFTTANSVVVNGVCFWNGQNFVAMGATPGVGGANPIVRAMALAPNGDLWIGGEFTTAGGSTADGLARWNVSAGTWTVFANGTAGDVVRAIAINKDGLVYIGGTFVNWDGNANSDYIVSYNGTAFSPMSAGANGAVYALAIGLDGTTLYVGGDFTSPQTRLMTWSGSAFAAMGGGASAVVYAISVADNGDVYVGGNFSTTPTTSYIAKWSGSAWYSLGTGLNAVVYSIYYIGNGLLSVAGNFTVAGGLGVANQFVVWNGSRWIQTDIDFTGGTVYCSVYVNGVSYVGHSITGSIPVAGRTTVTALSTAPVYPIITITGTTTAASTSTLQWLENQTTGERLYFSLVINTGEIITIDLRPQARKVTSNWRGQIFDQPLPTSDFSSWHLVTGANTIAAFMTGTITGATMTMNWEKIHASIDGEAA